MEKKTIIVKNKIRCKKCGDIIESKYRHDYKECKCGAVAVDGGHDYIRRIGEQNDYEELYETKEVEFEKQNENQERNWRNDE